MSIKGTTKELYIGKEKVSIINIWGRKKTIRYNELKEINYCYANNFSSGFIDFIPYLEEKERFYYKKKANDLIEKTVIFITENVPNLSIINVGKTNLNKENQIKTDLNFIDPLALESAKLVISKQKASIGMLQRVHRIGFNRAAKIMEELMKSGIVSEPCGVKALKVRITQKEFDNMQKSNLLSDNIGRSFDNMDGHEFEHFCAGLLSRNGFFNVKVTQESGDHGIDIFAEKDGISYAIQCKCYSGNVGNSAIQEAYAGKSFYKRDIGVVLTNRDFTAQAIEEAKILNIKLWNREQLLAFINTAI